MLLAETKDGSHDQWVIIRGDTLQKISDLPPPVRSYMIGGSVNGLVLLIPLYNSRPNVLSLLIWNPSIRKHVVIQLPRVLCRSSFISKAGLRYDATNNDYKLLLILERWTWQNESPTVGMGQVLVYSLGEGCWRYLSCNAVSSCWVFAPMKYFKCHIYWLHVHGILIDLVICIIREMQHGS
ncbi:hypothetical protein Droror1_Dr00018487 [Drosera rotundifolia]